MLCVHQTESRGNPSESWNDSSVNGKIVGSKRNSELRERYQAPRVNDQLLFTRQRPRAGKCPVRPIPGHRQRPQLFVMQAQGLDA